MALQHISGRQQTLGKQVLAGLQLLDDSGNITAEGEFAEFLVSQLKSANGKVLNRRDLLTERDRGLSNWGPWFLEPIWLVLVAAALATRGQAEIAFPGKRIDAINTEQLVSMSLDDLESFTQISPPKETPVKKIREVALVYGVNPAGIPDSGLDTEKLSNLLGEIESVYKQATEARSVLESREMLWGEIVFDEVDKRISGLDGLIRLSEDVRVRNTVGKWGRLSSTDQDITAAQDGLKELKEISEILKAKKRLEKSADYLKNAAEHFGFEYELS